MTRQNDMPGLVGDPGRLAALERYDILDTPPEEGFDDVVEIARAVCETGVALVSLVAADRQWFKARIGLDRSCTGLDESVCAHCLGLGAGELLVIGDLARDVRTAANPLVAGGPRFRFYAGAPLVSPDGRTIGSLCVLDVRPRPEGLSPTQEATLRALARQVIVLLELRNAVREREAALVRQRAEDARREALMATQSAIAAAAGDLDRILAALVAGVLAAVPAAEGAAIELLDGGALVYRAAHGTLAPHRNLRIAVDGSLSGHVMRSGESLLCHDASGDPRGDRDVRARLDMRSALFAPLMRGGTALGVLMLKSAAPGVFAERDLETAELFAATVPLALAEAGQAEARRHVRASERRHRAIFESAIDYAIVVLDLAGTITNWNEGARRILGWTAEETLGQSVDVFFTPEDRRDGVPGAEMRAALVAGRGADERWHLRKDGTRFWANGEMMTLRDDDSDEAIGFIKILRDRTEQRAAAVALERQKRDLEVVLDTIPVGILFAEAPSARVVGGNRRLVEIVGHPLKMSADVDSYGEWIAYHADGTRVRADDYPLARIIQRDLDRDELECEYERPDGTRLWIHISGAAIRDADGALRGSVVAVSDVSARRQADDLRSLMNQELSHRMKNLLTIVQAIARQTIRTVSDLDELQKTLSDRLMVLGSAHDVLLGGSADRASIAAVVRSGLGVLGEAARARLTLSGPPLDVGPAAALPLGLMLHELSTNATKYGSLSNAAGEVHVAWRVDPAAQPPLFHLVWRESGGPPVSEPTRKGFGSSLITRGVSGLRGGKVTLAYPAAGVECRVEVWLSELSRGEPGSTSG